MKQLWITGDKETAMKIINRLINKYGKTAKVIDVIEDYCKERLVLC